MTTVSKIALPATIENLHTLIASVKDGVRSLTVSPKGLLHIELALEEALVNIINYAYKGGRLGDIEVCCTANDNELLTIEIIDSGAPFNVLTAPQPDLTLDVSEREPGGLGVHLMKQLMHNVTYRREGDRNILEFQVRVKPEEVSQ